MIRSIRLGLALALGCGTIAVAQPAPKRAVAVRLAGAIHVDGRLNDADWIRAEFFADFRQREPVENGEPGDRTEVAFLFDDRALYVGARMRSHVPAAVPRDLTRRDQYGNAEHLVVSLDPFHDRRTAYSFSVTSSGVRRDYYTPRDNEGFQNRDFTFDPVWDARVQFDSTGWTAEMRIPFSQLRFSRKAVQEWGLNLNRWIPTRNEDDYWIVVPRNQTGFASRFGTLAGLDGIKPARRIELVPYLASNGTFAGTPNARNLLNPNGREVAARAGADLKVGLGPNLTVDAAFNPDFGQVDADPAEVNLTAFETFFSERRPFFTEGSQLLRSTVDNYFYSRRIGASPRGDAVADFVRRPANTTILAATKITGRLASGLSIGGLTAITDREFAKTYDSLPGRFGKTLVEPRAQYGVIRLQQQFGADGSTIGAIVSGVHRSFSGDSAVAAALSARAVGGAVDWVLRFQGGRYEITGDIGGSSVEGSAAAITAIQASSRHYLQRPDFQYRHLDPTARSLRGLQARIRVDKNAGNWLGGAEVATESPGFETNDMGRIQGADDIDWNADINHRWTVPGRLFRGATVGLFTRGNLNYDGVRTQTLVSLFTNQTWKNFMSSSVNVSCNLRAQSDVLTRGGPLMGTPAGCEGNVGLNSSFASKTAWRAFANVYHSEDGDWQYRISGGFTLRPTSALSVSVDPNFSSSLDHRQYITALALGRAGTYGTRYLFGAIRRTTIVAQIRLNYTFSPNLTLEAYAEPFAAGGSYRGVGELSAPRSRRVLAYGTGGTTILATSPDSLTVRDGVTGTTFGAPTPDFNALSFRSNLVLRWEWRPGSTLFLVWQHNRARFCTASDPGSCPGGLRPGSLVGPGALGDALGARGDNFLAFKISYWLPV